MSARGKPWGQAGEKYLKDLPDIKAYAEAMVTSSEVLEKFTRRRFVAGYEREEGQGD